VESALTFPSESHALNLVTVHPRVIALSCQLLGVPEDTIRLSQSEAWGKTGIDAKEFAKRKPRQALDQRIHCDYPNHTLVHPSPWNNPDAVSFILYLSDHQVTGGGTALVRRTGNKDPAYGEGKLTWTPGVRGHWINDKTMAEENYKTRDPKVYKFRKTLYDREEILRFNKGTMLVYRQDLWHRGRCVNPGARRYVMNLTFRKAEAEWVGHWHPGWARKNYGLGWPIRKLETFIASLTPVQRTILGFPSPGSKYWNPFTLKAVEARYSPFGMDMKPYKDAYRTRREMELMSAKTGRAQLLYIASETLKAGYSWRGLRAMASLFVLLALLWKLVMN